MVYEFKFYGKVIPLKLQSARVGITTDGDILYFNEDTIFDKFKLYDKTKPAYAPFYVKSSIKEK